jgi:hypothetical protein
MARGNRFRSLVYGPRGWAWAVCLLAACVQAALPIVHGGHAHATQPSDSARADPLGPALSHRLVAEALDESHGDDEASCPLCQVIGMTRSAVFLPGVTVASVGPNVEADQRVPQAVASEAPRFRIAAPRGPPAAA